MALVGCGAIIAAFVVPVGGELPIVGMLKSLGGGFEQMLPKLWVLVLAAAAALGLVMSFMPSGTSGGTGLFAWLIMGWMAGLLLFIIVLGLAHGGAIGELFKAPKMLLGLVNALAIFVLSGYGLATIFGKSLEA
jgi:hypothetical protein